MKLFEYEAKEIFKKSGIPVLDSALTDSPEEALSFFEKTKPVVIKSQVLSGGRGKAGGIKFASNEDEYRLAVEELIGKKIKDLTVRKVLIEKKIAIKNEIYMGYTIDS
jgi:succinyl-CoA synthetase beta subunit